MLGSLLRASSYSNLASITEGGATNGSFLISNGGSNGSIGLYNEDSLSLSCSLLSSPPILDHVPDDLKYKLFGSKNVPFSSAGSPSPLSSLSFRILIAEETGRMCRNNYSVVMDYSTARGQQIEQIRPNELKEYIFGSPIRTADLSQGSKFRNIPNSGLIMITRVFYWEQHSTNRLTVSLCVPAILLPVIPEAWGHITKWLDQCQNIIEATLDRHRSTRDKGMKDGLLPNDLNVHFPKECDSIVQLLQHKLIPCLRSIMGIPRLFLYPEDYKCFMRVWFNDIFSWIEIKDGPRNNFLPALLGKIICDFKESMLSSETTRVVIMSGNMVVANKLLFIISGLLEPKYRGKIKFSSNPESTDCFPQHNNSNARRDALKKYHNGSYGTDLSKYTTTNKGWEIPRNSSRNSMVSLSSNEQLAEVIQPSSLKSAGSSLHYLSSSLSSHNGSSYGSWFNKFTGSQTSPSLKGSDHWDKISAPINTPGSITNTHQTVRGLGLTPQPSPSISEYEEFPWMGTPGSPRGENIQNTHSSTRQCLNCAAFRDVKLKRDCQRIDQSDLLDEAFFKICKPGFELNEGEYEIVPGDSRHAAFMQIDIDRKTMRQQKPLELLPRYTSYLPKLNHWFKLQGFPVGPESESRVIHTMRKDLQVSNSSRTLLISLRSREIKEITIMRNDQTIRNDNRYGLVQKTKKLFNNGKCGNISSRLVNCIEFVNASIRKAMALCEDADLLQEQTDQEILEVFDALLHYTSKC